MRKSIIKLLLIVVAIPFLLSSCLGDTNQSITRDNSLSYITRSSTFSNYAITQESYYIGGSFVETLDIGRFYYLKYSLSSDDQPTNGVYNLNSVGFGNYSKYPIPMNSSYLQADLGNYETVAKNNLLNLMDVTPFYYSPVALFGDRWVFSYQVKAYEEDLQEVKGENNIQLNVVLQPSEQANLSDSQAILNIYLSRKDETIAIDESKPMRTYSGVMVLDLSRLRSYFTVKLGAETSEAKTAYTQFQYYKYQNNKYDDVITKVGALSGALGGNYVFGMFIGGKQ